MLIKSADDKQRRLRLLEDLQASPLLERSQRQWLQDELQRCQRGMQGERDAAFYIDHWKKDSEHHAVLHDLRLQVDGDVAQIDHLVISATQQFYLFETKCYSGDVHINEHGEWAVSYPGGRSYGVPSPLEQSRRHQRVLEKLLGKLDFVGWAGAIKPSFHHVVLLHPKAKIHRPPAAQLDTRDVIKADMIQRWHEQYVEAQSVGRKLGSLFKLQGSSTLREWAEKLARQHRPSNPLELPDFMKPKAARDDAVRTAAGPDPSPARTPVVEPPAPTSAGADHPLHRKLICARCEAKISFPEGRFCWNQEQRFGGLQYCREHQAAFK